MVVIVPTDPLPCPVSDILVACPLSHLLEDDLKNLLYVPYHDQVKSTSKVDSYTAILETLHLAHYVFDCDHLSPRRMPSNAYFCQHTKKVMERLYEPAPRLSLK